MLMNISEFCEGHAFLTGMYEVSFVHLLTSTQYLSITHTILTSIPDLAKE